MRKFAVIPCILVANYAVAAPTTDDVARQLSKISASVSQGELHKRVETLVGFGTRHTLSSHTDSKRGIGAALRWSEEELRRYSAVCGNCLEVGRASQVMEGRRLTGATPIVNVFALQRGTERPNDVVIITGHIDSRVTDVMDAVKDAPGANDDGSGSAAVLEAARVLSKRRFPATIVYALLSGEEQGLYGGKVMADYARAQGWNVIANLNNDIIGNSCGSDGVCDARAVRVFSEGPRWQGREELATEIRSLGGENDAPSRNLSRFLDQLAERIPDIGLDVRQIWRNDRFGRGGDHTEFLNAGYPAVRFSVAVENYNHQHQDLRVENGVEFGDTIDKMDFPYLAKVVRLNVAAIAALASAPPPPRNTRAEGAVQTFTRVLWDEAEAAQSYAVRWRRTDAANWSGRLVVPRYWRGGALAITGCSMLTGNGKVPPATQRRDFGCQAELKGVRVDDWVFGVSSVSKDGYESPVAAAVPGGAFTPYVPPAQP
jgi:hypothetical protein